jgi:O-antigen/teichoic acid export membrane protein
MTPGQKQGIFGRVIAGLASTTLYHFIAAAQSILLVPLFLKAWGADGYGNWLILTAFVSYLCLLDLGGQNYIGNLLAFDHAQGNEVSFRQHLTEGLSLFSVIPLVSFLIFVTVLCYPSLSLPGRDGSLSWSDRGVLLFMGGTFLLTIPQGVFSAVYRATGFLVVGMMVANVLRLSFLVGYAGILVAGLPPVVYAIGQFATTAILTGTIFLYGYRKIPQCRGVRLSFASAWKGRVYTKGSLFFWLLALASAVNFQGVILILAAFAAPAVVVLYATQRTAAGLIGYIGNIFVGVAWPEFSLAHGGGEKEKLSRMVLLTVRAVVFLSAAAAVALWILLPGVYSLWTARTLSFQPWLMALFLAQGVLAAGWTTAGWVMLASNEHRLLAWWALANAGLTIGLAILLAPRFGVIGVAVATFFGDLACGVTVVPRKAARFLGMPPSEMYRAILQPALVVLLAGSVAILSSSLVGNGWARFLTTAGIGAILLYPSMLLAFGRDDLDLVKGRFRQLLIDART